MPARKGGSYIRSKDGGPPRLVARTEGAGAPGGAMPARREDGRQAVASRLDAKTRAPKAAGPVATAATTKES